MLEWPWELDGVARTQSTTQPPARLAEDQAPV